MVTTKNRKYESHVRGLSRIVCEKDGIEARPFINADHFYYWKQGDGRIIGCKGGLDLTFEQRELKADMMKKLHELGKMKRGKVLGAMSKGSMNRFAEFFMNHVDAFDAPKDRVCAVFFTYGKDFPSPFESKADLRALWERMRRKYPGFMALWGLECQSIRQAPHYNVMFVLPYADDNFETWVRDAWIDITGLGGSTYDSRHEHAIRMTEIYDLSGALVYFLQEMGKVEQKVFTEDDHPGRWWGAVNREGFELFYRVPLKFTAAWCSGRAAEVTEMYDLRFEKEIRRATGALELVWFVRTRWFGWAAQYIMTGDETSKANLIKQRQKVKEKVAKPTLQLLQ